jgi:protoporphyrin/coproporphyrin ferrochelatase
MTSFHSPIAVLLMAYGSPDSLEDIEPYLLDIRGGRPTPPELVAEIKERYALIGGRSPILDLTRQQAAALEARLNRDGGRRFRTYVGMRHWQPRIKAAVAQIAQDGISHVIALAMAPHYSKLSAGAYFDRLDEAIRELGVPITVTPIQSWHDQPGLIAALAEKATAALARFPSGLGPSPASPAPKVVFTAHSLPARILKEGDPYDAQLRETACLLAGRLALPADRWRFCYQSAGRSPEPWLGPPIEDVLLELVQAGEKRLLVVPIGFVCDHVEILYDLDIAARKLVEAHGAHFERSESLNASPTFIAALAEIVKRQT